VSNLTSFTSVYYHLGVRPPSNDLSRIPKTRLDATSQVKSRDTSHRVTSYYHNHEELGVRDRPR
jgi:hypothetical protein